MDEQQQHKVPLSDREKLLRGFPCFESLSAAQIKELSLLLTEVHCLASEQIVLENELVDSIYIIVDGEAEVTKLPTSKKKKEKSVPLAILGTGEGIGIHDTGFYSKTAKRTATVTATTEMHLLKLEVKDLYAFLKKHNLELSMYAASLQMLRMRFIKQSLPFAKISHERLEWLANHVEDIIVPAGEIIFKQGEIGDTCYLIRSGEVEIITLDEQQEEHVLAILKPPVLFGEATLITRAPRNATARALKDCELLILQHKHLSELIESEDNVAKMFMTLMVDRSRPLQNQHVTIHYRSAEDGQKIAILKNPDNGSYFKLSEEGAYIWQQLNGENTMQEITLDLAEKFQVFAPDVVAALISKLTKAGFISNLTIEEEIKLSQKPFWIRAMVKIRQTLESRIVFGDSDQWTTKFYNKYVHYFFTTTGQIILAIFAIAGLISFSVKTPGILSFFNQSHTNLFLFLSLIPLSLIAVFFHELAHAFAVKFFGREVHYIGVGWYWFSPIAFTDTSDMWLSPRRARMIVNLAGIYMDILMAGLSGLLLFMFHNPFIQGFLWLFSFYTYLNAFKMLSPLQEMDGYYILMDWVGKSRLRESAVIWLVKIFPKSIRHPKLFRAYKSEIIYWVVCLIYLILLSMVTFTVMGFVFTILGMQPNYYLSLSIPFLVIIFSCLSIMADIRSKAE